jgi:predicted nucleic acid-binding Zn finger protein
MVPVRFSCVAMTIASAISLLLHTYFVTLGRGEGGMVERGDFCACKSFISAKVQGYFVTVETRSLYALCFAALL